MTDETFTAQDIRATVQEGVSLETAWNIGKALAEWLGTLGAVVFMHEAQADKRIADALIEGVRLQGRDASDHGAGDRNTLMQLITSEHYSGGIFLAHDMIQDVCVIELYGEASQLITAEGGLQDIAEMVAAGNFIPAAEKGKLLSRQSIV